MLQIWQTSFFSPLVCFPEYINGFFAITGHVHARRENGAIKTGLVSFVSNNFNFVKWNFYGWLGSWILNEIERATAVNLEKLDKILE